MPNEDKHEHEPIYPEASVPVIFSDGVTSIANSDFVVKFYLIRKDPDVLAGGPVKDTVAAQVSMPIDSFAATTVFFRHQLDQLIASGQIKQDFVTQLEKNYEVVDVDTPS